MRNILKRKIYNQALEMLELADEPELKELAQMEKKSMGIF